MEGTVVYIVDYDIPESPARNKVRFYRDLKNLGFQKDYSTLSVIRTMDKMAAEAVYLLVMACGGSAHVYKAEEITSSEMSTLREPQPIKRTVRQEGYGQTSSENSGRHL